jgi:hypothetical protein
MHDDNDIAIEELNRMSIETIGELQNMITSEFLRDHTTFHLHETSVGFLRTLMLHNDIQATFVQG